MTHELRPYVCEDCGADIRRPARGDRPKLCTECAIRRVASNAYRRRAYGVGRRQVLARQASAQRGI